MACFVAYGKGVGFGSDNGWWYEDVFCATTVSFQRQETNPYTGNTPWDMIVVDGTATGNKGYFPGTGTIIQISTFPLASRYAPNPWGGRQGNCDLCLFAQQKRDCINGKCELSSKYNTPGEFPSLEACEAVCGNGVCVSGKQCLDPVNYCPAGKVCIESAEHTRIQSLINQIKGGFC
jgi:hypothetical protein